MMYTQQYHFTAESLVRMLVMLLDWHLVRDKDHQVERILISKNNGHWVATVYYWISV